MSILEKIAVILSLSVARLRMEKFRGEQKTVTRFRDFLVLFYQYSEFEASSNAHESGRTSPGAIPLVPGTFCRDLTKNKVPAVQGFYLGFAYGKINIPTIPRPSGDVVANDWCIFQLHFNRGVDTSGRGELDCKRILTPGIRIR